MSNLAVVTYSPRIDGARCFDAAVSGMRERFLAERLPGENARQWLERTRPDSTMLGRAP